MLLKAVGVAALAMLSPVLISATPPPYHYPHVKQVLCTKGKGSAFRIGPNTLISVEHVTSNKGCKIDGETVNAVPEKGLDFSVITTTVTKAGGFKVNCGGFKPGGWYYAIGFSRGLPWQQTILLRATHVTDKEGLQILSGPDTVVPGQSGGPVIEAATGEVVGTVNAYIPFMGISISRPLKGTSLCRPS